VKIAKHPIQSCLAGMLLFLYVASIFKPYAPFLDYALNYTYISKVLCINKDKVGSCCKGKCHLTKQLKKSAEKQADSNTINNTNSLVEYDFIPANDWEFKVFNPRATKASSHDAPYYSQFFLLKPTPPPKPFA
jgi:hypothetical protein